MPKKRKRGPLVSSGIVFTRETFLVQLGRRVQFGGFLKFCRAFAVELFWSLQVYRKKIEKTQTKSHDYSRLFSLEKRRLKTLKFSLKQRTEGLQRNIMNYLLR